MNTSGLTAGDLALLRDNNGMFGGSDSWAIFLFFLLAFNGGGFGFNNRGEALATNADIQRGFDTNTIVNKLDGITNGLCDGFYAINNSIKDTAYATQTGINNLGFEVQNCCCTTNRNIDNVRYENSKNTCDIINAIHADGEATRNLITQNTIQGLRDELEQARGIISNSNQTRYILDSIGRYVTNPPCPQYNCGCGFTTGALY